MDGLLSEKEQVEALRSWWQENGLYIVAGIVLGIALLVGWRYWTSQQNENAAEASALYEELVGEVAGIEVEDAEAKAAEMYASYPNTAYAGQARLAMAKLYMSVGRDQDAAEELAALLAGDADGELQMVGRLRLAKILLYQEKPQEVIDLLQGYNDTAFAARYAEASGDAYAALGRFDEARQAYTAALAEDPQSPTVDVTLVRMKINDLPRPSGETDEVGQDQPPGSEAPAAEAPASEGPAATPAEEPENAPPAEDDE